MFVYKTNVPNVKFSIGTNQPQVYKCIVNITLEHARLLLRYGSNPNAKTLDGWIPMRITRDKAMMRLLQEFCNLQDNNRDRFSE